MGDAPSNAEPDQEPNRLAEPVDAEQLPRLGFAVVGIGGSAGGLEAFTEFFKAMPPDSGMAFVVIQHLPPDRESMIATILSRHTKMKVLDVEDGIPIQPNHVYIIRPGRTLTIQDGKLHLGDSVNQPRHTRPVDDFFRSLAEEQRERAICVIMSGMGSNGTAGAQAIKAVGGVCIAQDPVSAQFPSMPRNLIDVGGADYILPPGEMPEILIGYARHPYAADRTTAAQKLAIEDNHLREILAIVQARTHHGFSGYKKPTMLRRIERRMGLNRVTDIGLYAKMLRQNSAEVIGLGDDLLIHVTGFFRDAQAWETLRQKVIVPLVQEKEPDAPIRCWVAGCASGEEAYSLGMLLIEELERVGHPIRVKIFATDSAERSLSHARNGIYPGGIEAEIPPERLQRFFDREDSVYRVRQNLRECVIFAPQNVLADPPFSKLDIASCRNLLIYLEPDVQKHVIAVLHFGLKPGGALFLGSSEGIPPTVPSMFETVDKKARIYRRDGARPPGLATFPLVRASSRVLGPETAASPVGLPLVPPSVAQLTARALVAHHVPVAVTVDRNFRVVYFQGDTRRFLAQPGGAPTHDLIEMVNEDLRGAVRIALQRALADGSTQTVPDGWLRDVDGRRHRIRVTASPLVPGKNPDMFVVSFREHDDPLPPATEEADVAPAGADGDQWRDEVRRLREELQSAMEELQASNEEHRAAAEEAMTINEELQSSNEELETSKEEMQSLNEELSTVNAQLHAKMDELQRTSGDLRSLLASTDIAVIFLDSQFQIRRYTPAARNLLEIIGTDVGRPLSDLAWKFTDPELLKDARSVLARLMPIEREVFAHDGRWYARRILPYRTVDDHIEGVVITFIDITERKKAHEAIAAAEGAAVGDLKAMGSLQTATGLLMGAREMTNVLDEILHAGLEFQGTPLGDIQMLDADRTTLQIAVYNGFSKLFLKSWGPVDFKDTSSPPVRAMTEHVPIIVENVERDLPKSLYREKLLAGGIRGLLCVPLLTRSSEPLGVFSAYFREPHRPDERSLRVTELLARQGAEAVERMHVDEELARVLQAEQMARRALNDSAQIKDQFLATLSHELRTPLSAILLWGKLLRGGDLKGEEMNEGMDAIIDSAEAQARLVDDLLDTSRIAAGKLRLESAQIDLRELVHSVIEQNEPAARAKGVRLQRELSPEMGLVIADPTRLRQVVWNLVVNAIKFTPSGGTVTVTLMRSGPEVTIRVADTGAGIAPDFLPYVFDRFRQYEASITRKHGGLGLGLSISKQLVELHGGTIRADSAGLNQGATFTVTLPLPAHTGQTPKLFEKKPDGPDTRLKGVRVLLVEDNAEAQRILRLVLARAGAEVTLASDAKQALRVYPQAQPDVLVSDIGLPDLDGYQFLAKVRTLEQAEKRRAVPAVALSAYTREEDRRKASEAGYQAHLGKPADAEKLIAVILSLARA